MRGKYYKIEGGRGMNYKEKIIEMLNKANGKQLFFIYRFLTTYLEG